MFIRRLRKVNQKHQGSNFGGDPLWEGLKKEILIVGPDGGQEEGGVDGGRACGLVPEGGGVACDAVAGAAWRALVVGGGRGWVECGGGGRISREEGRRLLPSTLFLFSPVTTKFPCCQTFHW